MNPLAPLLEAQLPAYDVGILRHGFADHGRDYVFVVENSFPIGRGNYELTFTHVVQLKYLTAVSDDVWRRSWNDHFISYHDWEAAGEPDGYLFGTNWSLACPGFEALECDPDAEVWSERLQQPMFAAKLETDRFRIDLIFRDVRLKQLNEEAPRVSRVIIPISDQRT